MRPSFDPLFVGRQEESARIKAELLAGKNLVLTGRFGIGRTAVLRHLSWELRETWAFTFLDGADTPGRMRQDLFADLFPQRRAALRRGLLAPAAQRRAIAGDPLTDLRSRAVVLDDIAKVTRQRIDFARWLRSLDRFQVLAVTERFLPEEALLRLRTALAPAPLLALDHLDSAPAKVFFQAWSEQHGLGWGPEQVHGLVQATRGYPLGMRETAGAFPLAIQDRDEGMDQPSHCRSPRWPSGPG
jgi:hypothetical protein